MSRSRSCTEYLIRTFLDKLEPTCGHMLYSTEAGVQLQPQGQASEAKVQSTICSVLRTAYYAVFK